MVFNFAEFMAREVPSGMFMLDKTFPKARPPRCVNCGKPTDVWDAEEIIQLDIGRYWATCTACCEAGQYQLHAAKTRVHSPEDEVEGKLRECLLHRTKPRRSNLPD